MATVLKRCLGPVERLVVEEWTVETPTGKPAVSCPRCARAQDLNHRVLDNGQVSLLWQCEYEDCEHQAFLVLENWGEDVVPA